MTRTVPSVTVDDVGVSVYLVRANYWDGAAQQEIRLTDAPVDLSVDVGSGAETWTGTGLLMSVSAVTEGSDFDISGVDITFDGVDQTIISVIMGNQFRGQPIEIYKVWYDIDTAAIVGSPLMLFKGYQNEAYAIGETNTDNPDSVAVSTRAISLMSRVENENAVLTNPVSHLNMLTRGGLADTTANFWTIVPSLVGQDVYWGQVNPRVAPPYINKLEAYNDGAFD